MSLKLEATCFVFTGPYISSTLLCSLNLALSHSLDCGGRWCTNIEAISSTCSTNEPPPSPPISPPSPSLNTFYCGTSWMNAKDSTCKPLIEGGGLTGTGTACANGNSTVCEAGAYCYADIICSTTPHPTNMPVLTPPTTPQPTMPPMTSSPNNPGALIASTTR